MDQDGVGVRGFAAVFPPHPALSPLWGARVLKIREAAIVRVSSPSTGGRGIRERGEDRRTQSTSPPSIHQEFQILAVPNGPIPHPRSRRRRCFTAEVEQAGRAVERGVGADHQAAF